MFPQDIDEKDRLSVTMESSSNIKGKFIASVSYKSNKYLHADIESGQTLSIGYPYRIFLTMASETGKSDNADFKLSIKYVKFDPNSKEKSV